MLAPLSRFEASTAWVNYVSARHVRVRFNGLDAIAITGGVLSVLFLACLFGVRYLPMVDLPQHAALISVWARAGDPAFPESRNFVVNWRTPYLVAYVFARVITPLIGVLGALKVVVWLSAVGHQLAFAHLVKQLGHPRWLTLLGLPLALGYGFYFGFVSFVSAVPLAILALSAALVHREHPSWQSGGLLGGALCATLATHGFAAALTLLMVGPLLLRGGGTLFARVLPLVWPLLLTVLWLVPGESTRSIGETIWSPRFRDLIEVPALLFAASAADHLGSLFGCLALALVLLSVGSPSRSIERWAPLSLLVLGFCLFPLSLHGFGPLHPRFAVLMVPGLLLAFEPRRVALVRRPALLVHGFCVAWFAVLVVRLAAFDRETRPIEAFIDRMPRGLRVRPVIFDRDSQAFPALPALLHLSAYYAAAKGGMQGYSFAMYPNNMIRYVPTYKHGMGSGDEWAPERFSATAELKNYDCFLIHSRSNRAANLFGDRIAEVTLEFHEADWWAYRVHSS